MQEATSIRDITFNVSSLPHPNLLGQTCICRLDVDVTALLRKSGMKISSNKVHAIAMEGQLKQGLHEKFKAQQREQDHPVSSLVRTYIQGRCTLLRPILWP